ncbi:aspartic proteinase nepenthesin-2-like [Ananas comosus]|uniref:Aspartic proteinase nepenthesin-2-like n=1 Tax=Ananas comosus TaxID=4615 RepID=A0A6P5EY98_ANACO|nr:aspartic proteinase nepenthesin-2-like [Ananas comosus]
MAPFLLAIIAILHSTAALANPSTAKGFTLELIHRDSIHSPLYPGNLTAVERVRRFVDLSESRLRQLKLSVSAGKYNDTALRPELDHVNSMYLVKVSIGTPPTTQHLVVDTATYLTWVQCHPCRPCFEQNPPFYKPAASTSHRTTPCSHPLCEQFKCTRGKCRYKDRFMDKTFTKGTLSMEVFTFTSSNGGGATESIPGLVFGCSTASSKRMFKGGSNVPAGLLGMNMESTSFATQIAGQTGDGRFSYCLPRIDLHEHQTSFLHFGGDIPEGPHFATTPIVRNAGGPKDYYLKLHDISVNGKRLNLPRNTFKRKPDGSGGCIIDSGTGITYLEERAFNRVVAAMIVYFKRFENVKRVVAKKYKLKLCYRVPESFREWPSMAFHFEGADLLLEPVNIFMGEKDSKDVFCLTMIPETDGMTILGSSLQQKFRFVFDVAKQQLRFAPENCGRT